jgi:hypothetical protein
VGGGDFGGKKLGGENFGEYFVGGILQGILWGKCFWGGGILERKVHYASYNIVIRRVSICIILCS